MKWWLALTMTESASCFGCINAMASTSVYLPGGMAGQTYIGQLRLVGGGFSAE
jgi:hypothetical protein